MFNLELHCQYSGSRDVQSKSSLGGTSAKFLGKPTTCLAATDCVSVSKRKVCFSAGEEDTGPVQKCMYFFPAQLLNQFLLSVCITILQ